MNLRGQSLAPHEAAAATAIVQPSGGPSWIEASMTIANTLIGAGVLGLPYALKNAGWAGILVMLFATAITCFTAKALIWSFIALNASRKSGSTTIESYDALAEAALGAAGGVTMKVLTVLECYGLGICYIVLHTTNWPALLSLPAYEPVVAGLDARTVATLVVSVLVLPTLLVRSSYLSSLSIVGLTSTCMMFVVAVVAPLIAHLPLDDGAACPAVGAASAAESTATMGRNVFEPSGLGIATGMSLFAFSGHATFPELYCSMSPAERPHFFAACDLGFLFAGGFYATFAAIGYFFYGACAADTLTLNLMQASPVLGSIATLLVLTSSFVTFSVVCVPVVRIIGQAFNVSSSGDDDGASGGRQGLLQPMSAAQFSLRLGLVAVAFLVAVAVPNFGFVVSLMGAFTTMLVSFILPVAFYLYACRATLGPLAVGANALIIAVGLVGMFVGVQSTLASQM